MVILRPVRVAGGRAVHLLSPRSTLPLCGLDAVGALRKVGAPSEHGCNACFAEASAIRDSRIAWAPKVDEGGC